MARRTICRYLLLIMTLLTVNYFLKKCEVAEKTASDVYGVPRTVSSLRLLHNTSYNTFWKHLDNQITQDGLYPENFEIDFVLTIMRNARVVSADILATRTSLKWMLVLEGTKRTNLPDVTPDVSTQNTSMLDFRNMPYTTGRVFSWRHDILPVASADLSSMMTENADGDVCCNWTCCRLTEKQYCFKHGKIAGTLIYYLKRTMIDHVFVNRTHHPFHPQGGYLNKYASHLPGESEYCKIFRNITEYNDNNHFVHVLDMAVMDFLMLHYDGKHSHINENDRSTNKKFLLNVMVDYGLAFCKRYQHPDILLLAPIYQCCRMKERTWLALERLKDNFTERFNTLTRSDPLYPVLLPAEVAAMHGRLHTVISIFDLCLNRFNKTEIIMKL